VLYASSRSKVDFYGLEVYPALLLAVAVAAMDLLRGGPFASPRAWAAPWWGVAAVAGVGFLVLLTQADSPWVRDLGIPSIPVALLFLGAACAAGLAAAVCFARRRPALALVAVAGLSLVLFEVQRVTYAASYDDHSMKFAADLYNAHAAPGDLLVTDEPPEFEHAAILSFYTGQTVRILRDREGSIMHFIEPDRDALCIDEPQLQGLAQAHTVFLVGDGDETPGRLADLGLSWSVLGTGADRALYRIGAAR
jgi:hypothetical protein